MKQMQHMHAGGVHACVCMCPHPPNTFQIRGFCNGCTKVRVVRWLGCSGRPCLKVSMPHHHIISLPFHTSLSVWLILKIKLHFLQGSVLFLSKGKQADCRRRGWGGGCCCSSMAVRLEILWWWQWWPFPAVWVAELCLGSVLLSVSSVQVWRSNITSVGAAALTRMCKKWQSSCGGSRSVGLWKCNIEAFFSVCIVETFPTQIHSRGRCDKFPPFF